MQSRPGSPVILPLTGIRGFAALWVVLYHLRDGVQQALPGWGRLHDVLASGYLGVDLFAFLSGFVIAHNYAERLRRPSWADAGRYLWIRLARIYPLHLFVLLAFLGALAWFRGPQALAVVPDDGRFWRQLLMVHGWGLEGRFGWNVPSWTVSSEWFCYLCFPLLAPLLVRVERGATAVALAAATLGATAWAMAAVGRPGFDAFLDWGLLRIGGEFVVGCWLQRAHRAGFGAAWPWGWIGLLALGGGVATSHAAPAAAVACFAVGVYALAFPRPPLARAFGNAAVVWLGEVSYAIYMVHWFVLVYGLAFLGERAADVSPGLLACGLVAAVLALAALAHVLVERPSRRFLRGLVARPRRPAAAAGPADPDDAGGPARPAS